MYRRLFLALASTSALAACATTPTIPVDSTVSKIANDVAIIAGGLQAILPAIAAIHGISTSGLNTVNTAIADLQVLAQQIATVVSITAAQPIVQQVATDVNAVLTVVAGLPSIPASVSVALQSASILLPIMIAAVGIAVPQKVTAHAAKVNLTPHQARGILYDLAH